MGGFSEGDDAQEQNTFNKPSNDISIRKIHQTLSSVGEKVGYDIFFKYRIEVARSMLEGGESFSSSYAVYAAACDLLQFASNIKNPLSPRTSRFTGSALDDHLRTITDNTHYISQPNPQSGQAIGDQLAYLTEQPFFTEAGEKFPSVGACIDAYFKRNT